MALESNMRNSNGARSQYDTFMYRCMYLLNDIIILYIYVLFIDLIVNNTMHIKYMYRCINTHAVYISMKVYNLHVYNVHMQCIHLLLYLSIYIIPSYKNPIQSYQYIHTHTQYLFIPNLPELVQVKIYTKSLKK